MRGPRLRRRPSQPPGRGGPEAEEGTASPSSPYLSIDPLWLYLKNHSVVGAQQSVPTGPGSNA